MLPNKNHENGPAWSLATKVDTTVRVIKKRGAAPAANAELQARGGANVALLCGTRLSASPLQQILRRWSERNSAPISPEQATADARRPLDPFSSAPGRAAFLHGRGEMPRADWSCNEVVAVALDS